MGPRRGEHVAYRREKQRRYSMGNIARRMKAYVVLNSVETREAGLGIGGGDGGYSDPGASRGMSVLGEP